MRPARRFRLSGWRLPGRAGFGLLMTGALLTGLLSGCAISPSAVKTSRMPQLRPAPAVYTPPPESVELARYYQRVQRGLLVSGLLRSDGGGVDTPFTDEMLARNFMRLAFSSEYALPDRNASQPAGQILTRWDSPVRISLQFGASVPKDKRAKIAQTTKNYGARLARLTGLTITTLTPGSRHANFRVFIVDENERRALEPKLARSGSSLSANAIRKLISLDRENYCHIFARSPLGSARLTKADVVIRSEIPPQMLLACLHEEIAQGLGISNDHPKARPSIFNDDEEFGRLTTHDEMLLRILYDPRLEPGMGADEARPIVREIARELLAPLRQRWPRLSLAEGEGPGAFHKDI